MKIENELEHNIPIYRKMLKRNFKNSRLIDVMCGVPAMSYIKVQPFFWQRFIVTRLE